MEAAESWHTPPYEITGGNKLIWFIRWRVWRREKNRAERSISTKKVIR